MFVEYEAKDNVAILTINRPETLNALCTEVLRELDEAVTKAERDGEVYVLVLTGAGRAFVAGADIVEMKDKTPDEARAYSELGNSVFAKIEALSKPVIAAVNGYALGGGCELAMACDIIYASEKAKFGQPETGLGITPGFGGTQRLPRIVGAARAKELIFTAQTIDSAKALEIGLVSAVFPADTLMEKALELAAAITKNAQVAVRQSKAAINRGIQCDIATALAFEAQAFGLCFSTEDQKNAMDAFANKTETPRFKGM